MIALTQKDLFVERYAKQREPFITIGLHVMKVESNRRHRIHQVKKKIFFILSAQIKIFALK